MEYNERGIKGFIIHTYSCIVLHYYYYYKLACCLGSCAKIESQEIMHF